MSEPATGPNPASWRWRVPAIVGTIAVLALLVAGGGGSDVATSDPTNTTGSTHLASTPVATSAVPVSPAPSTTFRIPTITSTSTSTTTSTVPPPVTTIDLAADYEDPEVDPDNPAVANRVIPDEPDAPPPTTTAPPPWASSERITEGGHVSVDVGCADDTSLGALDRFFADRIGPVLGWDYQHVYPLGGDRYLWLFQDAFVDHSGTIDTLAGARFVHNAALVQDGACFRLLHRGTSDSPKPFEVGDGRSETRITWWWPMGGELAGGRLWVFWAEMLKDPYDPDPPDGLGWHPVNTYLASYDPTTLARTSFALAPDSGVAPIYGYAVSSDETHTYLFGNTFEQNLLREGGFWASDHSATAIWLARVPRGQLTAAPEYRTSDGWSSNPADAVPIVDRFFVENPMQPRHLGDQWVSATAVDGYWGDSIAIDVADQPWGPWYTVQYRALVPRGGDPRMNTYHAHVLPWSDGYGSILVSVSNNARDMRRDAWYSPYRYRPTFTWFEFTPTPTTTTTTSTTTSTTSTSSTSTTTTSTSTTSSTSTTTTTVPGSTTTTSTTSPTSTTTALPPTSGPLLTGG